MKKAEMIKKVSEVSGCYQKDVDAVLEAFGTVVLKTLDENREEKITLPGVGTFSVKNVPEREGTVMLGENKGSKWVKPAHDEICFKISKSVKELA